MSLCVINGNGLLVQMLEDVRNYRRIFDAGNHLDLSTTTLTGFDIDIESDWWLTQKTTKEKLFNQQSELFSVHYERVMFFGCRKQIW